MSQNETERHWQSQHERHSPAGDAYMQSVRQFPPKPLEYPTLRQLRYYCRMSELELARSAGIHYCIVRWMEQDLIAVKREMVVRVLEVLSQYTGYVYRVEDIRGLRVRDMGAEATRQTGSNRGKSIVQ